MSDKATNAHKDEFAPPALRGFEPAEFTKTIDSLTQWAMRYMDSLQDRDVSQAIEPGQIGAMLPDEPPREGMEAQQWDQVIEDIEQIVEPGLMHWQSPRFFAYFPCSSSMPGVMGEFVASVLNVNGMLWSTSPSVTEIEMKMMDWCAQMFGLPDVFRFDCDLGGGGCIQGTASEAAVAALVAARKKKVKSGRDRSTMTVYTSTQAHSSILKAAMITGLADDPEDQSRVRLIGVDKHLRMDADALMQAIREDIAAGLTPCLVSTTQGTTSTGAFDPLKAIGEELAKLPEADRPWLHVDAAWAGAAAVCEENRFVLDGVEAADSLCINPHKWLLTNFDCDLFWVRDRKALTDSMSITPAYLRNAESESGAVIDYRDWHVPLGRRMRALKLWFVIRYFGIDGLKEHIRHHIELAKVVEAFVHAEPRLSMATDRSLGLVCFRVIGESELTERLIERVNDRRRVMISHTVVPIMDEGNRPESIFDRWVARVAVGASGVRRKDIDELIVEISAALDEVIQ
ncbi:aspartate aminotransferase family protein [bacterium]|nr:MAG: aspartate aminotransferase family protein [bacterium]